MHNNIIGEYYAYERIIISTEGDSRGVSRAWSRTNLYARYE